MLSDDERRELDAIERDLFQDQAFAGRFTARGLSRHRLVVGDIIGLVGLTLVLTGLVVTQVGPASRVITFIAGLSFIAAAVVIQLADRHQ